MSEKGTEEEMTDFALPRKAVDLFEACPCDAALEDAEVLFGVYVEGLFVYVGVVEDGV